MAEDQFDKIQIDRTEEIRNWANKMKEVNQNEKEVKIGIVAANNHYGGYGPGTVDMFRQSMAMEKVSFENVDIAKIGRDMKSETRFTFNDGKQVKKGNKQVYPTLLIKDIDKDGFHFSGGTINKYHNL